MHARTHTSAQVWKRSMTCHCDFQKSALLQPPKNNHLTGKVNSAATAFSPNCKFPTCSVTSRIHFDQELACRHSEVRPVVRGSGRRITFTSRCQWRRAVSLFCRPGKFGPVAHACTREKRRRRRTDREAEAERKVRSKGKSCTKTNSCNPKVTMTNESSKEGLRWPVWTGGSRSFAVFEQWRRESSSATVQTPFW